MVRALNCGLRGPWFKACQGRVVVQFLSDMSGLDTRSWKIVMGPQFKVSSERLEKPGIKPTTLGLTRRVALPPPLRLVRIAVCGDLVQVTFSLRKLGVRLV